MEQQTINHQNNADLMKLIQRKQEEIGNFAKEIAEKEFEVLELNFMISTQVSKKNSEKTDKYVSDLRKKVKEGKINLEEADKFIECLQ